MWVFLPIAFALMAFFFVLAGFSPSTRTASPAVRIMEQSARQTRGYDPSVYRVYEPPLSKSPVHP